MSVPNQKVVYIHKRKYTGNFLQIGIDEMRLAQQQMTYCEFVLYLYLAGNADGFKLELSQQAFENTTGYKKTAYHNAVNKLIELGYLTQSYNYHYEFHTTPVRSSKLNFEVLSNGKSGAVKIYAQNCLQAPADLKSAGNSGVVHDRL